MDHLQQSSENVSLFVSFLLRVFRKRTNANGRSIVWRVYGRFSLVKVLARPFALRNPPQKSYMLRDQSQVFWSGEFGNQVEVPVIGGRENGNVLVLAAESRGLAVHGHFLQSILRR